MAAKQKSQLWEGWEIINDFCPEDHGRRQGGDGMWTGSERWAGAQWIENARQVPPGWSTAWRSGCRPSPHPLESTRTCLCGGSWWAQWHGTYWSRTEHSPGSFGPPTQPPKAWSRRVMPLALFPEPSFWFPLQKGEGGQPPKLVCAVFKKMLQARDAPV